MRVRDKTGVSKRTANSLNSNGGLLDLNKILESIRDPFCIIDRSYTIVRVNDAYLEHKDKEEKDLLGKKCYKTLYGRDDVCRDCVVEKAFISADPCAKEKHVILPDGSEEWYEIYTYPIISDNGSVSHVIEYIRDVTSRTKAEKRLKEVLKEVKDINQELNEFAYVVSHDLKAPLRAISSLASWLASDYYDKLDDEGKGYLNLLVNLVKRMDKLINSILQYSRLGRIKEEKVEVDLNELIKEMIDILAPPENIKIRIENELPVIYVEETRIRQVFQNLLSNAIKYMDKPEGMIRVGCVRDDGYWRFSVSDNGHGIEEKYFEKIFHLFQTLQSRDETEGTGIGLTLVKKIIDMYGGRIWVESELGKGSTFYFTLPIRLGNSDKSNKKIKGVKDEI